MVFLLSSFLPVAVELLRLLMLFGTRPAAYHTGHKFI